MGEILAVAGQLFAQSQNSIEAAAQNIANIATTGYKRRVSYVEAADPRTTTGDASLKIAAATDFAPGKAILTGHPFDFAISGSGFFALRAPESGTIVYTRQGQFHRDADGRLISANGMILQGSDGVDVVVPASGVDVASDGMLSQAGEPIAKLGVMAAANQSAMTRSENGMFSADPAAMTPVDRPGVSGSRLESSNVSMGDEMVTMMIALRRAESAQRLVQAYDDAMGRALTAFGQA